ncbi:unnamed protein product [Oppiella nova]|uniref:Uncharacterized protein n=1 Tax=Oppiella nova TaxID=334625 RepID=A0A7R9QHV6_9ACAR|nr:unnamed protein product [Oppiella nova]CAG2166071.1 unnamed protein product [Oppiella nova]
MQLFDDDFHNNNNESLDEFRSRLRLRRSIKNRDQSYHNYGDNEGDRSDFSYDSATKEAHQQILRNAESLRLEQEIDRRLNPCDSFEKREESEETLNKLCARRQEEIRLATLSKRQSLDYEENGSMHGLQRSSTDYFGQVVDHISDDSQQKSLTKSTKKGIFSSPRLRHKTQSQVLRAASSIPSLIFPLKSNKNKNLNTFDMLDSSNSNTPDSFGSSKKSSIDEGLICNTPKTRRSPLRFLGNFVDDKLFRGRFGSTKRAKSSVELGRLSWEIPDDLTDNNSNNKLNRRKSYNKEDSHQNNTDMSNVSQRVTVSETVDTTPKTSASILKRKPRSLSTCVGDRVRHRIPSATSDRLSLSSSSAIGSDDADIFLPQNQTMRTEISADALAEIEVMIALL